ncbi:sensor histidine kinase [Thermoactinomyces sp. CICC 10523]|uniref:ATP-binding protein n=1 Tax=Thermoactinomyces sp. CICC 10523 TaxID=2767428 RepID=UPI0018DEADBE|nr:sensor histidine kinase [Thermoactinomyces sp. CICC 10523]MBH8597015.1 sensor histidine kinase [Thermoactinomyces sp. CICC 10523]
MNFSLKPFSLRTKINILVLLIVGFVLILVMSGLSCNIIQSRFEETGNRALLLAKTVAGMPQIRNAFLQKNPSAQIEPLAEEIRRRTGAEFIVVGNMHLIRYSHPNPAMIGKKMVGGDNQYVLHGKESITQAAGTLGLSIRGKAPIFDEHRRQIGVVSVGFPVQNIWNDIFASIKHLGMVAAIGLVYGFMGAHLLSGHIKKQLFNMEPHEIALLSQKQHAIMESIREGILAVDRQGKITACNQEAKRLIGLEPDCDIIGQPIRQIVPNSRLPEVLEEGVSQFDQPMIIHNSLIIANRVPVLLNGRVIGAVSTFRDKLELDKMNQQLNDVRHYADALRSQRHEFLNRLHTISGLIQMQEYELVREFINQVNEEQQHLIEFFMSRIHDPAVVGILIGKINRAKELGIQLTVDPSSHLREPCPHREVVISVLGNAIENALEALAEMPDRKEKALVSVYINDQSDSLQIRVTDNGPGVDPELGQHIFESGISTKGKNRGFGLAIVSRLVAKAGGKIAMISANSGATLEVNLPKEEVVIFDADTDPRRRCRR